MRCREFPAAPILLQTHGFVWSRIGCSDRLLTFTLPPWIGCDNSAMVIYVFKMRNLIYVNEFYNVLIDQRDKELSGPTHAQRSASHSHYFSRRRLDRAHDPLWQLRS